MGTKANSAWGDAGGAAMTEVSRKEQMGEPPKSRERKLKKGIKCWQVKFTCKRL